MLRLRFKPGLARSYWLLNPHRAIGQGGCMAMPRYLGRRWRLKPSEDWPDGVEVFYGSGDDANARLRYKQSKVRIPVTGLLESEAT